MTRLRILVIVGVLVAGSLMLACSSKKNNNGNQTPAATASSTSGQTPGAGTTPSATGGGDTQAELDQLAGEFASKPLTASYTYSSGGGGTTDQGSLKVYASPPNSWRLDIISGGSTSILIKNADGSFICDESSSSCFASPTGSTIPLPFFGFLNDPAAFASTISGTFSGVNVDRSDVTIAGQSGHCYAVSSSVTGAAGTVEYCFTDSGLLLRAKVGASGSEFSIEATSIESSVDPANLALPYPLTSLGG